MLDKSKILRGTDNREITTVIGSDEKMNPVREAVDSVAYDEYREQWKAATNMDIVTDFPTQLDFELNYSCNFSCPMCTWNAESTTGKGKKTWFDFDVYKEVIDEAVKRGTKSIRLNYVNEPLIRKDIVKFIKYAREAGVLDLYFSTNGSLLTEKMSNALIDSGLLRLQVSLDAFKKETYEKIRLGGIYEKVIANVERFLEIRKERGVELPTLRVNFVKTKDNLSEIDEFIDFWKDKADLIGIQDLVGIMDPYSKSKGGNRLVKDIEDFKCAQPFQHLTIRYDGTILPCCSFFGAEIPIAQLKTSKDGHSFSDVDNIGLLDKSKKSDIIIASIEETWNGKQMNFFREIHSKGEYWKHPVCKACVESTSHHDETQ
tara:strand:+ start:612 stop:1730 length:1119 start_codon:yes stop_codon:yes gene_type:complete